MVSRRFASAVRVVSRFVCVELSRVVHQLCCRRVVCVVFGSNLGRAPWRSLYDACENLNIIMVVRGAMGARAGLARRRGARARERETAEGTRAASTRPC
eukprot:scaffold130208_cov69-Phaeocystis_antarctica.AAC.2